MMTGRPLLITVFGVLFTIVAISALIGGAAILMISSIIADFAAEALAEMGYIVTTEQIVSLFGIIGIVCLIVAAVLLIIAIGFFKGWKFVWYLFVIMVLLNIVSAIALVFIDPTEILPELSGLYDTTSQYYWMAAGVLIDVLILYYMFRPKVKVFFSI
jgi:hypothetical protein